MRWSSQQLIYHGDASQPFAAPDVVKGGEWLIVSRKGAD
jgi:hypothetical protein